MHEWIPVTKELPDDERCVLITRAGCKFPSVGLYVREHDFWVDNCVVINNVTAWMELPERYKGDNE